MEIEKSLKTEFIRVLQEMGQEVGEDQIVLERSRYKEHGDFATNVAMRLAKVFKRPPTAIADDIIARFRLPEVDRLEKAGPGFVNIFLKDDSLQSLIRHIAEKGADYGAQDYGSGHRINVEYVSANPTGELHLGHARGAAVGDSLTRILKACGYEVTREYYINDAGNQVNNLGRSVEARYLQRCQIAAEMPESGYFGQDIVNVAEKIYDEIGDAYALDGADHSDFYRERGIALNFDKIKQDLADFRATFDVYTSERWIRSQGLVEKALADLKGCTYEAENAVFLRTVDDGDDKDRVLVKSDGSYTYLLPDIAYHRYKYQRGFETVIDILGADHHGYVARLKSSMKSLGLDAGALEVLMVQMVRLFKNGEEYKMSKRTGNAVSMHELCQECGTDAVRYFFVTRSASSHLDFDLDLAKTMGSTNPVYYCQYAHARLATILESASDITPDLGGELLTAASERELLRCLGQFPSVVLDAGLTREPYKVTIYIRELAVKINDFYTQCRVLDPSQPALTAQRLGLVQAAKITLENALDLIGVSAPNHM